MLPLSLSYFLSDSPVHVRHRSQPTARSFAPTTVVEQNGSLPMKPNLPRTKLHSHIKLISQTMTRPHLKREDVIATTQRQITRSYVATTVEEATTHQKKVPITLISRPNFLNMLVQAATAAIPHHNARTFVPITVEESTEAMI